MAKNILKEAIADAKAVREVALANAKAALEEAFTPRLQSMLSAKLSETLNEEEEELEETYNEEMDETMDETYSEDVEENLDEEIDLEEILNELELEEGDDSKEETVDEAKDDDDKMEEAKKDDKDDVKEAKDKDDDKVEEAKDDKEELEEQRPIYKAEYANDPTYKADHVNEDTDFDLDSLLEEINNLDENKEEDLDEDYGAPKRGYTKPTGNEPGGQRTRPGMGGSGYNPEEGKEETNEIVGAVAGIMIGALPLIAVQAAVEAKSPEEQEVWKKRHPKLAGLLDFLGATGKAMNAPKRNEEFIGEGEEAASDEDMAKAEAELAKSMNENTYQEEIAELKAALEVKSTELNEVNLLNSKLLYVNRIFKANTLNESQKLRVVETLDKAESAKEAKLIYETIKDTFNVAKSKKASVKNKTKSLKEGLGMASKAAGTSTAPRKEVISESTNMVNRFQKLANIKISQ
jgi:hypothetical protein